MNQLSRILTATAVASLAVAPAMAAPANPAASLSVVKATRAHASAAKTSKLGGGDSGGLVIALGAGVAIIVAIIVAGSIGSKEPTSP